MLRMAYFINLGRNSSVTQASVILLYARWLTDVECLYKQRILHNTSHKQRCGCHRLSSDLYQFISNTFFTTKKQMILLFISWEIVKKRITNYLWMALEHLYLVSKSWNPLANGYKAVYTIVWKINHYALDGGVRGSNIRKPCWLSCYVCYISVIWWQKHMVEFSQRW